MQFILQLSSTWNEKLAPEQFLYCTCSFSELGPFLTTGLKCWLIRFFQKKIASTLSYKKIRVKQIQSNLLAFSRGQLLERDRYEFDSSYVRWWCESSFFCNYHCSKWHQKQKVYNKLVTENKSGTDAFWVRYFFQASSFWGQILFAENEFVCFLSHHCLSQLSWILKVLTLSKDFSQSLSILRYCVCKNRKYVCWNSCCKALLITDVTN